MKHIAFILAYFLALNNPSAQTLIKGRVLVFNSLYNTGKLQPVSNVSIKAECCTTPDITDPKGNFSLSFFGLNGNAILYAEKNNIEVINTPDLTFQPIPNQIVNIYVLNVGDFEKYKIKLKQEAIVNIEKRYQKLNSILNTIGKQKDSLIELLSTSFNKPNLSLAEAFSLLSKERAREKQEIPKEVETLSYINLDISDSTLIKAFEAFRNGDYSSVINIKTLNAGLSDIQSNTQKISTLYKSIDSLKSLNKLNSEYFLLRANSSIKQFDFKAADSAFYVAFLGDSNNIEIAFEYGDFLLQQTNYTKAITIFQKALDISYKMIQAKKNIYLSFYLQLEAYNRIGNIYNKLELTDSSVRYYSILLNKLNAISKVDTTNRLYKKLKINAYNNIGTLLSDDSSSADEAIKYFIASINLANSIYENDSLELSLNILSAYNNLSNLYRNQGKISDALEYGLKAMQIHTQLMNIDSAKYNYGYALSLENLGLLYMKMDSTDYALRCFERSLPIKQKLAFENPNAYEADLAHLLQLFGSLFHKMNDDKKGIDFLNQAASFYSKNSPNSPNLKLKEILLVEGIAEIHTLKMHYETAIKTLLDAVDISKSAIADSNYYIIHNQLLTRLTRIYGALGYLSILQNDLKLAKSYTLNGMALDSSENSNLINNAHIELLNGDFNTAKQLYEVYGKRKSTVDSRKMLLDEILSSIDNLRNGRFSKKQKKLIAKMLIELKHTLTGASVLLQAGHLCQIIPAVSRLLRDRLNLTGASVLAQAVHLCQIIPSV